GMPGTTASPSAPPGSTRCTAAVQVTIRPCLSALGTLTAHSAAPASPGSGCSPGPVTTYAAVPRPPSVQTNQAPVARGCPGTAIHTRPAFLVASTTSGGTSTPWSAREVAP